MNGVLVLDKPKGITSQSAINKVKRVLKARKAGHTGTLDPFATGVLPICINKATKIIPFMDSSFKKYDALLHLGISTDTLDSTGTVTEQKDIGNLDKNTFNSVILKYQGKINQVPPMYSAIKRDGVRLYELARRGLEVDRPARSVVIYKIELLEFNPPHIRIMVECSRGTYIRALASDIGEDLGCGAHLTELRRIQSDGFSIEDAVSIEDVESGNIKLKDLHDVLSHIPVLNVTPDIRSNIRNGNQIRKSDLNSLSLPRFMAGDRLKICEDSNLISITEARLNSSDIEQADEDTTILKLLRVIN